MICIAVSEAPEARGVTLGTVWAGVIAELIAGRSGPAPKVSAYVDCVTLHLPGLALEVAGLAEGAGIDPVDAWWLQLRRELASQQTARDCSAVALSRPGVLGQTIDLPRPLGQGLHAVQVAGGDDPDAVVLTFAGLLGYLGINDAGLGVAINMVRSYDWQVGVPPYLLTRAVLTCRSLAEAVELLARVPRASSRCLTLLSGTRACRVEMTATTMAVTEGEVLATTNHFIHADLAGADASGRIERMESRLRLRRLTDGIGSIEPDACGVAGLLSSQAFQFAATVATVVMEPAAARIHVRPRGEQWTTIDGSWTS